jgi:hypothetical protein
MHENDILREVIAAREAYAASLNFDVNAIIEDLRRRNLAGDLPVVRREPRRPDPARTVPTAAPQSAKVD